MSEAELKPCKRCGHKPQQAFGYHQQRYYCLHCCHEFEKSVTTEWGKTEEEAREAWNTMQEKLKDDPNPEFTRYLLKSDIDEILERVFSVSTVSSSACQRTGSDYFSNVFHYIISEMAMIRNKLEAVQEKVKYD